MSQIGQSLSLGFYIAKWVNTHSHFFLESLNLETLSLELANFPLPPQVGRDCSAIRKTKVSKQLKQRQKIIVMVVLSPRPISEVPQGCLIPAAIPVSE